MASRTFLDLLKRERVHPLVYYGGGKHSKTSLIYATIASSQEIKPPSGPRKDYMLTFYISDPSIPDGSISVIMFVNDRNVLEYIKNANIIIIQDFMLNSFQGKPQIVMNRFTKYVTFTASPLTPTYNMRYETTTQDIEIAEALDQYLQERQESDVRSIAIPKKRPVLETCQIDTDLSKFFDYVGEVVEVSMRENRATISLTDYTLNPLPNRSYKNDRIVKEEYVINCTAWDSLINECENLQRGDYVSLCNCVKKDSNPLEFSIRTNNKPKDLISKMKEDDPRLEKLIDRKKKYNAPKTLKRITFDDYPLSTEMYDMPRKFTSIKDIKLKKERSEFQTQARILRYEPQDIEKWIMGWCNKCSLSSDVDMPCKKCEASTIPIYKVSLILKDNTNEELKVETFGRSAEDLFFEIPAGLVLKDEKVKEKLNTIITLSTDKEHYFEFALHSERFKDGFIYQFMKTRFIYEVDK